MTPEEIEKANLEKVKTAAKEATIEVVKKELNEKFGELIKSSTEFTNLKVLIDKINEAKTPEALKSLSDEVEKIGLQVKSIGEDGVKGKKVQYKSYADIVVDLCKTAHKEGKFKELLTKKAGAFVNLEYKAAETISEGTSVIPIGSGIPFALTEYEPGLTRVVRRQPFILQLVNAARTITEYLAWAEQTTIDPGAAGNTSEGSAKTQGSFRWTEAKQPIETMTYYTKATKRVLDDIALMENEIRMEIMELLALKLDFNILKGSGTTPAMKGILNFVIQNATTGIPTTSPFYHQVLNPQMIDCLRAAIAVIETNGTAPVANAEIVGIFTPNYIVMNPADVALMELAKDNQDRYLLPPFISDGYTKVKSLPVIANVGMTAGSFLVGDFTKSNVKIREDASIAIGFENDDFTKNLVTILGEMRAGHYIKTNHLSAFYSDTFDATKTAISKP